MIYSQKKRSSFIIPARFDPDIPVFFQKHLKALGLFLFLIFVILYLILRSSLIFLPWVVAAFFLVYAFFKGLTNHERKYNAYPDKQFEKILFRKSLILRIIGVLIIGIFAQLTIGRWEYVGAIDAIRYITISLQVADVFWEQGISHIYPHLMNEYEHIDNIGVPLVIGILYALTFKSVLLAKVFIAILGSWSVVFIYRAASYLVDQPTARLAAWMAAFFPLSMFYDAIIMKEPFVVFCTSFVIYAALKMNYTGKVQLKTVLLMGLAISFLFLIRTAAGSILLLTLVSFFFFNKIRGNPLYSWIVGGLAIGVFLIFLNVTSSEEYYLERIEGGTEHGDQRIASIEEGTTWANLALGPVFLVISHFAPFPSMVDIGFPYPFDHYFTNYEIPGLVSWNILAIFVLLGFWHMIKYNFRRSLMILGYTIGFTIILGITAMFTQVRLGWNIMPMMMIPAAIGLKNYRSNNWWYAALIAAGLLIIGWNIFRAIGRGVI